MASPDSDRHCSCDGGIGPCEKHDFPKGDGIEERVRARGQLMMEAPGPLPCGSYQSDYDAGMEDMQEKIVAFMRGLAGGLYNDIAGMIERGEHLQVRRVPDLPPGWTIVPAILIGWLIVLLLEQVGL